MQAKRNDVQLVFLEIIREFVDIMMDNQRHIFRQLVAAFTYQGRVGDDVELGVFNVR